MDVVKDIVNSVNWAWFGTNAASVIGMVLFLAGILLNFQTDAKATKFFGMILLLAAVVIIIGKLCFENGVLPLA